MSDSHPLSIHHTQSVLRPSFFSAPCGFWLLTLRITKHVCPRNHITTDACLISIFSSVDRKCPRLELQLINKWTVLLGCIWHELVLSWLIMSSPDTLFLFVAIDNGKSTSCLTWDERHRPLNYWPICLTGLSVEQIFILVDLSIFPSVDRRPVRCQPL